MPEQERRRIAKIFKTYVEKAVDELGPGYMVDLQGNFYDTPICNKALAEAERGLL